MLEASGIKKLAGIDILVSDKIVFKLKLIRGDKEGPFILIKGSINQGNITILNTYSSNSGATNFIKSILMELKTKINTSSIIVISVHTFSNIFVTWTGINRETSELNNIFVKWT